MQVVSIRTDLPLCITVPWMNYPTLERTIKCPFVYRLSLYGQSTLLMRWDHELRAQYFMMPSDEHRGRNQGVMGPTIKKKNER